MRIAAIIIGILCIIIVAFDAFETIVLPRRVVRRVRLTKVFYRLTWGIWAMVGHRMRPGNRREYYLSFYGPLSLILLLCLWASLFIVAFALLQWGFGDTMHAPEGYVHFTGYLYFSGTTFVTLGLGDITPMDSLGRALTVLESGGGLGFLALVIGYVPVIYQTFSRREASVSLLDARAGTPPSGPELLIRHFRGQQSDEIVVYLREWERWCAELLESHLSYPVLAYYRSQHENQSWLLALSTLLDVCALIMTGVEGMPMKPAKFIFAMARHTVVDLAQSFGVQPLQENHCRLDTDFVRLNTELMKHGIVIHDPLTAEKRLRELRIMYEPFLEALCEYFIINLPNMEVVSDRVDDWQTSAWDHFLSASPHSLDRAMRQG